MNNLLLAIFACFAFSAAGRLVVDDCSKPDSLLKELKIEYSPTPPVAGQMLRSSITAYLEAAQVLAPVELKITTFVNGVESPAPPAMTELCEEIKKRNGGVDVCPIFKGPFKLSYEAPYKVLPVGLTLQYEATYQGSQLFCFNIRTEPELNLLQVQ